jgi:hypothetical protein
MFTASQNLVVRPATVRCNARRLSCAIAVDRSTRLGVGAVRGRICMRRPTLVPCGGVAPWISAADDAGAPRLENSTLAWLGRVGVHGCIKRRDQSLDVLLGGV